MRRYQVTIPKELAHIRFVDDFQSNVLGQIKGKETLAQTWAIPFSSDSLRQLLYRKSLYVATTDDPDKAILGFGVTFSVGLEGINLKTAELMEAVCNSIGDPYPLFFHAVVLPIPEQEEVFKSLMLRCMRSVRRQKHYFSHVVILEQWNEYLRSHLCTTKFNWEDSFFMYSPLKATNVFVRQIT